MSQKKVLFICQSRVTVEWPYYGTQINKMVCVITRGHYEPPVSFYFFNLTDALEILQEDVDSESTLKLYVYGQMEEKVVLSSTCSIESGQQEQTISLTTHSERNRLVIMFQRPSLELDVDVSQRLQRPYIVLKNEHVRGLGNRRMYVQILQTKSYGYGGDSSRFTDYIELATTYDDEIPCVDLPSRTNVLFFVSRVVTSGNKYQVEISSGSRYREFITHNTFDDVIQLTEKAELFIATSSTMPVPYLFRNKPSSHETIIAAKETGIMVKYDKDNNGDQASSINMQIKGLFFSATGQGPTGLPPNFSPFGDYRIMIPPQYLLKYEKPTHYFLRYSSNVQEQNAKLYFADFYCKPRARNQLHYVTLVLTKPGSTEDDYCNGRLPELDINNNKFLFYDPCTMTYRTTNATNLHVEVLYTEDINLNEMKSKSGFEERNYVPSTGGSRPGGISKCSSCTTCNLPRHQKNP